MGIPLWKPRIDLENAKMNRRAGRPVSRRMQHFESFTSSRSQNDLDWRLQQRLTEKENILYQLKVTISLLDQFLSARAAVGSENVTLPSFIIEELPDILEAASRMTSPSTQLSPPSREISSSESTSIQDVVDHLLQIPPYSTWLQSIENDINAAHSRIYEQLSCLGNSIDDLLPA